MAFIGNHFEITVLGEDTLFSFRDDTINIRIRFKGGHRRGVEPYILIPNEDDHNTAVGLDMHEDNNMTQRILFITTELSTVQYNIGNNDYDDLVEYINSVPYANWVGGKKRKGSRKTQKKRRTRRSH